MFRPTASCIRSSFRSSGKGRLILTGGDEQERTALLRTLGPERPLVQQPCTGGDGFIVDLDAPYGKCGCVILASGLGKRFGGNKLMADFHGKPMLCRVLSATEGIFFRRVVVTRHEDVAHLCRAHGVEAVLHDLPDRSDTVRLGLEALEGVERCMYCPGDQPLLRQETVAALALAAKNADSAIWRAACGGSHGAPVLFPRWCFPELLTLPKGKGGGYVVKKYPEHLRTVEVQDPYELMDVDERSDLEVLLKR